MKDVNITLKSDGTFVNEKGKELLLRDVIKLARERRDAANAVKRDEWKKAKAEKAKAKLEKAEASAKKAQERLEKLQADAAAA